MSEKKVFCENCRKDVNYIEAYTPMVGRLLGRTYHYIGREAHCADCGSKLFMPELIDSNLQELYKIFRVENGIISLEQIRELPQKYSTDEKSLSLLLGWGEHTFPRYVKGDMPTKLHSDILLRLYYNPYLYSELLKKRNLKK
jgi:hypothetical protein